MKHRLTSPVVWGSVLAQVLLIVGLYMPNITDSVKIVGMAVIEILTLFGVLNNPTDKEGF